MILTGAALSSYVKHGLITVEPGLDKSQLRPFGLRVHLDKALQVPTNPQQVVDLSDASDVNLFELFEMPPTGYELAPGSFVLGATLERFMVVPSIAARLDGRSTLARLGLQIHCSSQTLDGMSRRPQSITLELANLGPYRIRIAPSIAIGQVGFETVAGYSSAEFEHGQYEGQIGPTAPRLSLRPDAPSYERED